MLLRLGFETTVHHATADNDRLSILNAGFDLATYTAFLSRIYGFEAPLDAALAMTTGVDDLVDLRGRTRVRLLRSDLQALCASDPSTLPRCSAVFPFRQPPEALGWMYAVERNTLLHGVIERHLRVRMAETMKVAGAYLSPQIKSTGARLRELGAAMDSAARSSTNADRIVAAAKAAFRCQHGWYEVATPSQRVA
jgi:heme oxygenase